MKIFWRDSGFRFILFFAAARLIVTSVSLARAEPTYRAPIAQAKAARDRGDGSECLTAARSVVSLCPDYPPGLILLAQAYALQKQPDQAMLAIADLQARGLVYDISRDHYIPTVLTKDNLSQLGLGFAANSEARGHRQTAITLTEQTGIIESLAYDAENDEWYFSDIRGRRILKRSSSGEVSEFSAPADRLFGVFGLVIDPGHGCLWASCSALPLIQNFAPAERGRAELVGYDLKTGHLVTRTAVPVDGDDHLLGDLALSPSGEIFLTDTATPMIWSYRPGADRLERVCTHPDFSSLQGIVCRSSHSLLVADYALGLYAIDLETKTATPLQKLPNATFAGIDGMALTPKGLLLIQNGINPQRVAFVRLKDDGEPAALEVLEQSAAEIIEPTHIKVVNDAFYFVGNSGWDKFPDITTSSVSPHNVSIFRAPLP